jgi:uncharacterized membrane protein YkoI
MPRSLSLLTVLLLLAGPAFADGKDDHDRARAALAAGAVRPLADILADVERRWIGQVIETELEHDDGRWVYEFKLLPPSGRIYKLELDATTGALLKSSGPVLERR